MHTNTQMYDLSGVTLRIPLRTMIGPQMSMPVLTNALSIVTRSRGSGAMNGDINLGRARKHCIQLFTVFSPVFVQARPNNWQRCETATLVVQYASSDDAHT